jgi:hypothetical protein
MTTFEGVLENQLDNIVNKCRETAAEEFLKSRNRPAAKILEAAQPTEVVQQENPHPAEGSRGNSHPETLEELETSESSRFSMPSDSLLDSWLGTSGVTDATSPSSSFGVLDGNIPNTMSNDSWLDLVTSGDFISDLQYDGAARVEPNFLSPFPSDEPLVGEGTIDKRKGKARPRASELENPRPPVM